MIWIVGSQGMLGSSLCKLLEKPFLDTKVDITSYSELERFYEGKGITHIINCAAYTNVDLAEKETDLAYAVNAKGVANLAKLGAKVIHFSTDYVFSGAQQHPYVETDTPDPINVYGASKYAGEKELGPDACIIRTSWLFGRKKNFVTTMLQLMQQKKEIQVVADQFGRPTFCDDLAQATCKLLDHSGIFHFANQGVTSWFEFAKVIFLEAKKRGLPLTCQRIIPITSSEYPSLAKRPPYSVLATHKIEQYGITPRPWKETLFL